MSAGIIGKKIGMTRIFGEDGSVIPVTVIQAGPCPVVQIKRKATDGYSAVQVGFDPKPERKTNKPDAGRFAKAGVSPRRVLREFRVEDVESYEVGKDVGAGIFEVGELVAVSGVSKGRGHAGAVKRHHSKGGPESHGSMYGRRPGSMGASSFPSRVWKGKKLSGHLGAEKVTVLNLKVVRVDPEKNVIAVRGAVPGPTNGYLTIAKSTRKKGTGPAKSA